VTVTFPADLSADGLEELGQYLDIFLKKQRKEREKKAVETFSYDSAGGYDVVAAQGDETCCADAGGRLGTSITAGCHGPDKVST
jgi:hypothetical protein